jgi:hypothetical protein
MWIACLTSKKHSEAACLQGYLYQLPVSPLNEFASDLVHTDELSERASTVSRTYEVVGQGDVI